MTALCFFGVGMVAGSVIFGGGDDSLNSAWGRGVVLGLYIVLVSFVGWGLGL